jgi:ribosome maturation factor RimP
VRPFGYSAASDRFVKGGPKPTFFIWSEGFVAAEASVVSPRGDFESELRQIAAEVARDLGLELVELKVGRAKKRIHLRIDVDRVGATGVGIEDCKRVSNAVDRVLEERDLIPGSYVLEVSSPGIDRPIRTADDVRRNAGRRVMVRTHEPLEGRTSFSGVLLGLDGENLRLREDDGDEEVAIPLEGIALARQEVAF